MCFSWLKIVHTLKSNYYHKLSSFVNLAVWLINLMYNTIHLKFANKRCQNDTRQLVQKSMWIFNRNFFLQCIIVIILTSYQIAIFDNFKIFINKIYNNFVSEKLVKILNNLKNCSLKLICQIADQFLKSQNHRSGITIVFSFPNCSFRKFFHSKLVSIWITCHLSDIHNNFVKLQVVICEFIDREELEDVRYEKKNLTGYRNQFEVFEMKALFQGNI